MNVDESIQGVGTISPVIGDGLADSRHKSNEH